MMRIPKSSIVFVIFFCLFFFRNQALWANNLSITNVSLESRTATCDRVKVQFDISWSNSWSDSTNRDGVWVFFKVCKNTCSEWVHGKMKTSGTNPSDTSGGSASLTRVVPTDLAGAFLYRGSTGSGTVTSTNVELALDFAAAPLSASATDTLQVRVFGLEMVYIPTGDFYIGPTMNYDPYLPHPQFRDAGDTTDPRSPVYIGSSQPYISQYADGSGTAGDITWKPVPSEGAGSLPGSRSQLNANFPTGYNGFWMMKYELTQVMYRDFLNTLTTAATTTRTRRKWNNYYTMCTGAPEDCLEPYMRQTIKFKSSGTPFVCDLDDDDTGDESNDGEWLAMNLVNWVDCAAIADWAGLRPLTEMEWEKAGHGTALPPEWQREACGQVAGYDYVAQRPITNEGQASETADQVTGDCFKNWFYGKSTIGGPLRVGFAATSTSTRTTANASIWGIMEMSGNMAEFVISLGTSEGRSFQGSHGNGILSTTSGYEGNATNTDWPGIDGTIERGVTSSVNVGSRGGSYNDYYITIEERSCVVKDTGYKAQIGCRLGRTSP